MTKTILWNTGVNDLHKPLPPGHVDPNWILVQGRGFSLSDYQWQKVHILTNQQTNNYFATTDSMWVWAESDGAGQAGLDYVFEMRFHVDVDPSQYWIEISGVWGTDNFGHIGIDQQLLPPGSYSGEVSLPSGNVMANYQKTHSFSLSTAPSRSQLRLDIGWHTLNVWVQNEGSPANPSTNPAGFNMSALSFNIHSLRRTVPEIRHR